MEGDWAWVMGVSEKSAAVRVCRITLMDIWIDFTGRAAAETRELRSPGVEAQGKSVEPTQRRCDAQDSLMPRIETIS